MAESDVNLGVNQKYQPLLPHRREMYQYMEVLEICRQSKQDGKGNKPLLFQVLVRTTWYFSLLVHGLLVFSWVFEYLYPVFLSKGDLVLDHQLLCISNCVLWSISGVWIFFMFFRSNLNSAPTFGFLGSWWAVQSALYPILLLNQNIKVWDDTQSMSMCAKVANIMEFFYQLVFF